MAQGSGTTLVIELSRLPLLPRVGDLIRKGYYTRASKTNATFVAPGLRIEGKPDPVQEAIFYDAQTSGGMLICVPAEKAEELVRVAKSKGAPASCIIGEVIEQQDVWLVARA
jgi:selenide,water dikinase